MSPKITKRRIRMLKKSNNIDSGFAFKLSVAAAIFLFTAFHLYDTLIYPQVSIIPGEILLGAVLILIVCLLFREVRGNSRLKSLNRNLITIHEQLERAEIDTITVLILTEEAKDPYVRGHSKRVAKYSAAIAKAMKLPRKEQRVVERAAILHDLGKLGVMDDILKKPGKLDEREQKIMRKHPRDGVEILKPLKFLSAEKEIILYHHEWYDGKGYPAGITGEKIPLGARIVAVADTFDAMNSERSYRKRLSRKEIISELKKASGSQLDPRITCVFLGLLKDNPSFWEREQ